VELLPSKGCVVVESKAEEAAIVAPASPLAFSVLGVPDVPEVPEASEVPEAVVVPAVLESSNCVVELVVHGGGSTCVVTWGVGNGGSTGKHARARTDPPPKSPSTARCAILRYGLIGMVRERPRSDRGR